MLSGLVRDAFTDGRFDCGTGSALLISPVAVKMGEWNQLVIARNENRGSLQLNDADVVQGTAQVCVCVTVCHYVHRSVCVNKLLYHSF